MDNPLNNISKVQLNPFSTPPVSAAINLPTSLKVVNSSQSISSRSYLPQSFIPAVSFSPTLPASLSFSQPQSFGLTLSCPQLSLCTSASDSVKNNDNFSRINLLRNSSLKTALQKIEEVIDQHRDRGIDDFIIYWDFDCTLVWEPAFEFEFNGIENSDDASKAEIVQLFSNITAKNSINCVITARPADNAQIKAILGFLKKEKIIGNFSSETFCPWQQSDPNFIYQLNFSEYGNDELCARHGVYAVGGADKALVIKDIHETYCNNKNKDISKVLAIFVDDVVEYHINMESMIKNMGEKAFPVVSIYM